MFSDRLIAWYLEHGRVLPWRGIDDPYRIWLSEIILQQTRIEQGMDYYLRFCQEYPSVNDLAKAGEEQVLKSWQGLGYYSRARNLHATAQYIAEKLEGEFPNTHKEILKLKGVGRYTAAAIASFAFKLPYPVIDGNVYRFISRLYGINTPIGTDAAYKEFEELLLKKIDRGRPDLFNQALMDFGSIQCIPLNPCCIECPFEKECEAYRHGKIALLPVKSNPVKVKERWLAYYHIEWEEKGERYTMMHRREGKDIWKGLYEFPLVESDHEPNPQEEAQLRKVYFSNMGIDPNVKMDDNVLTYTHKLTHRTIHASFYHLNLTGRCHPHAPSEEVFTDEERKKVPVSRLIDRYLTEKGKISFGV